jgi:CRP/FNR family transcriptional regulator, cyclic AMP receptor protein
MLSRRAPSSGFADDPRQIGNPRSTLDDVSAVQSTCARLVRVIEHDPDLARRLGEADAQQALRQTVGVLENVAPGAWRPAALASGKCLFGGLLLDGLLVREVTLGNAVSAELVGAGDLVLPHDADETTPFVAADPAWTALEPTRIAWLDATFAVAVRRWPELAAALLERSERRFQRLAVTQAIGQLTRVEDRVEALLWHLAERWGRVTSSGVVLPVRLTHRVIARLVGARRPSVTTAIGALQRSGRLSRREDGAWLLLGSVPETLDGLRPERAPWEARGGEAALVRVLE